MLKISKSEMGLSVILLSPFTNGSLVVLMLKEKIGGNFSLSIRTMPCPPHSPSSIAMWCGEPLEDVISAVFPKTHSDAKWPLFFRKSAFSLSSNDSKHQI